MTSPLIHGIDIYYQTTPHTAEERKTARNLHGEFQEALLTTFHQTDRAKLSWTISPLSRDTRGDAGLAHLVMANPKWRDVLEGDVRYMLRYNLICEGGSREEVEGFVGEFADLAREWYGDGGVVSWERDEETGMDPEYHWADTEGYAEVFTVFDLRVQFNGEMMNE
ncbi:hypothetical protein FKW77_004017 [Venturia effusa]|uniref:Uncharacterized protein n=1 Tax=Venturia effusa TaxID=50376 RepID=A0A517KZB0_9PEZI|nr:hypothetical protein FKW77_004017 [Venturia effusa]